MRIIQLSTGHLGGAGLAARRLNDQLNLHGVDSTFIALAQKGFFPGVNELEVERTLVVRTIGASMAATQRLFSEQTLMTSVSKSSNVVSRIMQFADPLETIIQIHNWQNIINFKDINELQTLGFKIILTLHDQRFFTGGCHYSYSCLGYEESCLDCPQVPKLFTKIPNQSLEYSKSVNFRKDSVLVVGPSQWIVDLAGQSSVLRNIESQVVPNVLGETWLKVVRSISFKKNVKFTIGVASMDPDSYIKGGDIIQEFQSHLPAPDYSIIYLSNFANDEQVRFWEQIDCLFVPSRADNSPNVIHEARSLGIPVVATKTGGIPEILTEADICFDLPEYINREFAISIFEKIRFTNRLYDSNQNLIDRVVRRDSKVIASYKDIYTRLLSGK
jgi:glycosyltransferase involved in cell wall biosynthesis